MFTEAHISSPLPLAWSIGWKEIILILVVLLLLFGGRKLPELARSLARGFREFKDELKGVKKDLDTDSEEEPAERADRQESAGQREEPAGGGQEMPSDQPSEPSGADESSQSDADRRRAESERTEETRSG